jgi:branched-chain amino acid transport system ATP-binding protein
VAALHIQNLKKAFGGLPAINDVSLTVEEGERRLIIGPNGAGKTTLFNLVTGDLSSDSGSISLFKQDITRRATHRRVHLGLARTYQIITLFPKDTLEHNIALSILGLSRDRWNVFGKSRLPKEAAGVLALVGLEHLAQRPVSEVAYGEKRRLEIAMALAQKPRVLLLDEPLAGLSREERGKVKQLISAIPRETTVVMIEHDMDTALDMADTITVLHYGRVIVEGTRAAVVADPKTREVYLGH